MQQHQRRVHAGQTPEDAMMGVMGEPGPSVNLHRIWVFDRVQGRGGPVDCGRAGAVMPR